MNIDFNTVTLFEEKIAEFFGAPYAVGFNSCTHAIETALRYTKANEISCPKRTYLSIPLLAHKLGIKLKWREEFWQDYYYLSSDVIDAAVLWRKNSYIPNTFMGLSFQKQKHLNLGCAGMLLMDNKAAYEEIKRMSYDGRERNIPWREQNISTIGYHYYLLPELAQMGLDKLPEAIKTEPKQWIVTDWPDLTKLDIFKRGGLDMSEINEELKK